MTCYQKCSGSCMFLSSITICIYYSPSPHPFFCEISDILRAKLHSAGTLLPWNYGWEFLLCTVVYITESCCSCGTVREKDRRFRTSPKRSRETFIIPILHTFLHQSLRRKLITSRSRVSLRHSYWLFYLVSYFISTAAHILLFSCTEKKFITFPLESSSYRKFFIKKKIELFTRIHGNNFYSCTGKRETFEII